MMKQITDPSVARAYDAFGPAVKIELLHLRSLIFSVAENTEGVGELEETLKWGQPSYLTTATKSGSSIRLGREKKTDGDFAIYFKCRTTLVKGFRELYPELFRYEGNRAILFNIGDAIPEKELSHCIALALTYNLSK